MNSISLGSCAAAAALSLSLLVPAAEAATFAGDFSVTTLQTGDPGLVLDVDPSSGSGSFDLEVGESSTFRLFDIWTDESGVNPDDLVSKLISVAFNLTSPSLSGGSLSGATQGNVSGCFFLGCAVQWGSVNWNNPLELSFGYGNTGKLLVSLSNETFNTGVFGLTPGQHFGASVDATFTYDTAAVPLPAGGALLLAALGGLAVARRRKAA